MQPTGHANFTSRKRRLGDALTVVCPIGCTGTAEVVAGADPQGATQPHRRYTVRCTCRCSPSGLHYVNQLSASFSSSLYRNSSLMKFSSTHRSWMSRVGLPTRGKWRIRPSRPADAIPGFLSISRGFKRSRCQCSLDIEGATLEEIDDMKVPDCRHEGKHGMIWLKSGTCRSHLVG
jgi:hypothetical protein